MGSTHQATVDFIKHLQSAFQTRLTLNKALWKCEKTRWVLQEVENEVKPMNSKEEA